MQTAREHRELAAIYVRRGLDIALALMAHDALGAHARDELGTSEMAAANPLQAALASASKFFGGSRFATHRHGARPAAMGGREYRGDGAGFPRHTWRACRACRASESASWRIASYLLWSALSMGVASAIGAIFGAN